MVKDCAMDTGKPGRAYHCFVLSEADIQSYPCWYLDTAHSIPPWTPLFAWTWTHHQRYGDLWAAETMGLPTCKGTDWREVDGCAYMCPVIVTDNEEKKAREARFKKHLQPFIKDFDLLWADIIKELTHHYRRFKAFDVEHATNVALYDHFDEVFRFNYRVWSLHSWNMYTLFAFYSFFENICQDYLGINDTSSLWHRMVRGFDNKMLQVDRQLWELSWHAADLGLDSLIKNTQNENMVAALSETDAGQTWLNESGGFNEFIQEHGWRMPRMMEFNRPSWVEDPSQCFSFIKQCFEKPESSETDFSRHEIIKDRKEVEREILGRFPESERDWISKLMVLTQKTGVYTESHNYYFEHTSHALMRRAALACARRMVKQGLMEDPEDFVFLLPDEFRRNIISMRLDYRPLIADRKAYYEDYSKKLDRPPLIGSLANDPQKAMEYMMMARDYVMMKVTVGVYSGLSLDLDADLYGNPAAPGLGQGRVCIVSSGNDLSKIKSGDILVAVTTYSSWTSVFPLIRGVVLDSGASLSHAAIVGREYNIPVLVQTKDATRKLKNGQLIRVDGNKGAVWII